MKRSNLFAGCGLLIAAASASVHAAPIGSDSFVVGGTGTGTSTYTAGNIGGQTSTGGTTGYFTGTASGNQTPGWASGTGAFTAVAGGLVNPNMPGGTSLQTNDGALQALGNANQRIQYRDFSSSSQAAGAYYFSALLQESSNSYTGTTFVGVGPSLAANLNANTISSGMYVGFLNGALTMWYNNGAGSFTTQTLVATPTASSTYMVELVFNGLVTPYVYNSAGVLVNTPSTQAHAALINTSTDLGSFTADINANFTGTGPATVLFDELRLSKTESDVSNVSTPEPASLSVLGLGAVGLLGRRRQKR